MGEQSLVKYNLDDFPIYVPLAETFQFLLLTKLTNPEPVSRLDDGSPIVRVGVIGFELAEIDRRLEHTLSKKLSGPGYTTDILLIYSDGPLFLLDVPKTVMHVKELAEAHNAQRSFKEIWFLAHYWTGDQKLYRVA